MKFVISHIALLVPSVDKSASYLSARGFKSAPSETFEAEGSKEIYVGNDQDQNGLLLLVEALSQGPYQRALAKRGPSLHHIAIDVLDMKEFLSFAEKMGWKQHSINAHTISDHQTAWMFLKGASLLEIHETKSLSEKPLKVSKVHLPESLKGTPALDNILGEYLSFDSHKLDLTIDNQKFSFTQIACL